MQTVSSTTESHSSALLSTHGEPTGSGAVNLLAHYQIIRRNGAVVPFEPNKIAVAMMKAFWLCMAHKALHLPACAKWSKPSPKAWFAP